MLQKLSQTSVGRVDIDVAVSQHEQYKASHRLGEHPGLLFGLALTCR
jgi:hypothetical protein